MTTVQGAETQPKQHALVREMPERIADKWTLLAIDGLDGEKELRFTGLRERISGVSHKMPTKPLRRLERDGLVTRRVHATVPPRVDYKSTPLGEKLGDAVSSVWDAIQDPIARPIRFAPELA